VPPEYKKTAASIIILSDPSMLGCFFIGGIWLLEKSEGLHKFWETSPLRSLEYVLSKALSLAFISTLVAALIALIGLKSDVNYIVLSFSVFAGSMVFTVIGLIAATYARSVNHYMLLITPVLTVMITPPILAAFGIVHPAFAISPGTALWHFIIFSVGGTSAVGVWAYLMLLIWLGFMLYFANRRIPAAMQAEGGDKL
jgi:fluoroquinolone transport system permease protein